VPGDGIIQRRDETETEMGERMARLIEHDPKLKRQEPFQEFQRPVQQAIAASGHCCICRRRQFGETEVNTGTQQKGTLTPLVLVGSASGEMPNKLTFGPLNVRAHFISLKKTIMEAASLPICNITPMALPTLLQWRVFRDPIVAVSPISLHNK